jgi:hypothetical protein
MEFALWSEEGESASSKTKILKDVKTVAESYCIQGSVGVSPPYASRYARNDADFILVGYADKLPSAFILAKHEDISIYLAVICGKPGTGRTILEEFLRMADKEGVNVSLSAMPNVLSYYGRPEFGFSFRKSCDVNADTVDASVLVGKKPPLTLTDIARDPVFGPFLVELQSKGFNVVKTGECAKRRLSADDIIKHHCEDDGYTMFRCRVQTKKSPRRLTPRKGKGEIDMANFSKGKGRGKRHRTSPSRYQ